MKYLAVAIYLALTATSQAVNVPPDPCYTVTKVDAMAPTIYPGARLSSRSPLTRTYRASGSTGRVVVYFHNGCAFKYLNFPH